MKYIKSILEFAMFSDVLKNPDKNEIIDEYINKDFDNDARLIYAVYLKKFDKTIIIKWNDTEYHYMPEKIENRTSFKSISDFNDFISKVINDLFNNHINEINSNYNKYALKFTERNFSLIIDIRHNRYNDDEIGYDNLFKKLTQIHAVTIVSLPDSDCKIIEINDEYF